MWITTNWKILKETGTPDHFTHFPKNLNAGQEATGKTRHGAADGSILGKEYDKSVYCCLDYLTCMQSTLREMPGWMTHNMEKGLLGEISTTSDIQMIPL